MYYNLQMARKPRVFISHSFCNREFIEKIEPTLKLTCDLYIAKDHKDVGKPLWLEIQKQIDRADIVAVLITPEVQSKATSVANEVGYAKKAGKCIIPLVTENADPNDLGMLSDLKWIAIKESEPEDAQYQIQNIISQRYTEILHKFNQDAVKALGIVLVLWAITEVDPTSWTVVQGSYSIPTGVHAA